MGGVGAPRGCRCTRHRAVFHQAASTADPDPVAVAVAAGARRVRELTLWERIRRAVSLAVTIAIAVVLALAVLRPSRIGGAGAAARGRTLIVLDSSWSMRRKPTAARRDGIAQSRRRAGLLPRAIKLPLRRRRMVSCRAHRRFGAHRGGAGWLAPSAFADTSWPTVSGVEAVHFITDGAVAHHSIRRVVVHSVFEAVRQCGDHGIRRALDARGRAPRPGLAGRSAYLRSPTSPGKTAGGSHHAVARQHAGRGEQHSLAAGEAYRQIVPHSPGGPRPPRACGRARERARCGRRRIRVDCSSASFIRRRGWRSYGVDQTAARQRS